MNGRLGKLDWINHGLVTLARDGPNALRVESMAKKLRVSRGSFYWHFRDIKDFRSELLRSWQDRSTDQVVQDLDMHAAPPDRLECLMRQAFGGRRNLDDAVRSWAADDKTVAKVVAATDSKRIAHIEKLLVEAGVEPKLAHHRATFLYWAYVGHSFVQGGASASLSSHAINDLSHLFQT